MVPSEGVAFCCHGYPMGHKAQFRGLMELPGCFLGVRPGLGSMSPTLTRGWSPPLPGEVKGVCKSFGPQLVGWSVPEVRLVGATLWPEVA